MSWERRFEQKTSVGLMIVLGVVFFGVGSIAGLLGGAVLLGGSSAGLLFLAIGLLFMALGVGIPLGSWFLGSSHTLVCTPEGFTYTRASRRAGSHRSGHRWAEVTETRYSEPGAAINDRTVGYFTVHTLAGQAFSLSSRMRGFREMIELFNSCSPLPYVWQEQLGFNVGIGPVSARRSRYARVARPERAAPAGSA